MKTLTRRNGVTVMLSGMRGFFDITPHMPIIEWAERNIDFSLVPGAAFRRLDFDAYPHTKAPIKAWEFDGKIVESTVCGIPQHGKTQIETVGVLYTMVYKAGKILCVYPSDDLASLVNESKYEPLMKKIPQFARELERRNAKKPNSYNFSTSTMIFYGAGRRVMSLDCFVRVLDETDEHPKNGLRDSVQDSRMRARSFDESMLCNVCTPSTEDGPIWQAFLMGSRGYWTLRCQGCGELTMRSCDINLLQFEKVYDEALRLWIPVADSIRLCCPKCGYEHEEAQKFAMNRTGDYIHERPELVATRPSFQFGVLCSLRPATDWLAIAERRLKSGRSSTAKDHKDFDNCWRGLPYKERTVSDEELSNFKRLMFQSPPDPATVEMVFMVSDTQDTFNPTGVFALDKNDNLYCIAYRDVEYMFLDQAEREVLDRMRAADNKPPVETLEDLLRDTYLGEIAPLFHVIDEKGHRTREVQAYAKRNRNVLVYCGTGLKTELWKRSEKKARTFLVNAAHFQEELIYKLYDHKDRSEGALFIPSDLPDAVLKEISAVRPDKTSKWGHLRSNWTAGDQVHDAFDVFKMAYFGIDVSYKLFPPSKFRLGESPLLLKLRPHSKPKPVPDKKAPKISGGRWGNVKF